METFLGGRSLPEYALIVSLLASVVNGLSVVSFLGHFYGHGFHTILPVSATPLAVLVTSTALVPLLYNMRVASIFQGLSYGCIVLTGLTRVDSVALYGPDCVQAFVMAATPLIIIGKVAHDSPSASPPLRPLNDFNVTQYIFNTNLDLTSDENFWSCLAGTLPYSFVRLGFDQMAVQRFIAARTLRQAKRIPVIGAAFVITFFVVSAFGALAIIYWYRDCDLALTGAISSYDEVVPYFVRERLSDVTMLRGLFLAGLLSASTRVLRGRALLVCALQLWHGVGRGLAAIPPLPVIPGTTERCPLMTNTTDTP
ncbi:hypothetical protein MTO96_030761 [Rhipicephalus appendiculatus]